MQSLASNLADMQFAALAVVSLPESVAACPGGTGGSTVLTSSSLLMSMGSCTSDSLRAPGVPGQDISFAVKPSKGTADA